MSMVEVLNQLRRLTNKYQTPFGLAIWGFTAPGQAKEILVDDQGRLQIGGTISASVDFSQLKGPDNRTLTDIYNPLASYLPNLDIDLSSRASEATLSSILNQLDITLSELRDALRGTGDKTFTDLETNLSNILGQLDITLSDLRDTFDSRLYSSTDALSIYDLSLIHI